MNKNFMKMSVGVTVLAAVMTVSVVSAYADEDENGPIETLAYEIAEAKYQKRHALQGHWEDVTDVEFSPNGKYAATVSDDGSLIMWKTDDGSQKFDVKFENGANLTTVTFSPDGKYVFTGLYDKDIKGKGVQLSAKKGKVEYAASLPGVVNMDYSPNGESLVVGYINDTTPLSVINIKKAKKGKKKGRIVHLEGHTGMNNSVEFSPDGKSILTTALDGNLVMWDAKSGRRKFGVKLDAEDATFSPNGQYIAVGQMGSIKLYDAKNGEFIRMLVEGTDDNLAVYELFFDVEFHPSGKVLAAASSNGSVFFFDVETGQTLSKLSDAHSDQIRTLDYNADGSQLITGSMDDTAIIWQLN